jgi:hypothetical protein
VLRNLDRGYSRKDLGVSYVKVWFWFIYLWYLVIWCVIEWISHSYIAFNLELMFYCVGI